MGGNMSSELDMIASTDQYTLWALLSYPELKLECLNSASKQISVPDADLVWTVTASNEVRNPRRLNESSESTRAHKYCTQLRPFRLSSTHSSTVLRRDSHCSEFKVALGFDCIVGFLVWVDRDGWVSFMMVL
jgi:hypothetical protein